jgi:hypothetical protein
MTVTNKCQNDSFVISLVRFKPGNKDTIFASAGAGVHSAVQHKWIGPIITLNTSAFGEVHVAVLRTSDGKLVVPKGANPDGTVYDISGTTKQVCLLFVKDAEPKRFGIFRMSVTVDGLKVLGNDFARAKVEIPEGGLPCEQYEEEPDKAIGFAGVVGRMVEVFYPGGCQFLVDDCSST